VLIRVQTLHIHVLAHTDALVEKDHLFFRCQSLQWVRNLHIDLELNDLAEFADHDIVADVEAEEELAEDALVLYHLIVDRFDHDGQHRRVLEAEVLKLNFPLSEGKEALVVVDALARIRSLLDHRRGYGTRLLHRLQARVVEDRVAAHFGCPAPCADCWEIFMLNGLRDRVLVIVTGLDP